MKHNFKDKIDGNELDLSLSELTEVPVKELSEFPKATHLDLSCNKLIALPISFSTLSFLIRLDLSKNELVELPHNFGQLKLLRYLDLYGNQLTMLPVSFSMLRNLKWLDLKNNPLNKRLQSIAGDCLDEKQCEQCSTRVVEYMQVIQSDLEREKQKRLVEERAKAAARRFEEEKETVRLKQAKKAEKEKRKAEQLLKKKEKEREAVKESLKKETNELNTGEEKVVLIENRQKKNKSGSGSFLKLLLFLLLITPLIILGINVFMRVKQGQSVTSLQDMKVLISSEAAILKTNFLIYFNFCVKQGKEWQTMASNEVKTIWAKWNLKESPAQKEL